MTSNISNHRSYHLLKDDKNIKMILKQNCRELDVTLPEQTKDEISKFTQQTNSIVIKDEDEKKEGISNNFELKKGDIVVHKYQKDSKYPDVFCLSMGIVLHHKQKPQFSYHSKIQIKTEGVKANFGITSVNTDKKGDSAYLVTPVSDGLSFVWHRFHPYVGEIKKSYKICYDCHHEKYSSGWHLDDTLEFHLNYEKKELVFVLNGNNFGNLLRKDEGFKVEDGNYRFGFEINDENDVEECKFKIIGAERNVIEKI